MSKHKDYGSSYQDEVEDRVRDLTSQEYEVFAFDNQIDPEDANAMSNFIADLNQDEATKIINQLKGEDYAKGGDVIKSYEKFLKSGDNITIEGNPYKKDEDFFIYRDGREVVSWGVDEREEDEFGDKTAKVMYDLFKTDKPELSHRLNKIDTMRVGYAKGGEIGITRTEAESIMDTKLRKLHLDVPNWPEVFNTVFDSGEEGRLEETITIDPSETGPMELMFASIKQNITIVVGVGDKAGLVMIIAIDYQYTHPKGGGSNGKQITYRWVENFKEEGWESYAKGGFTRDEIDKIDKKYGADSDEYSAITLPKDFNWKKADRVYMNDPYVLEETGNDWLGNNGYDVKKYGISPAKYGKNPKLLKNVFAVDDESYFQLLYIYERTPKTIKETKEFDEYNNYAKGGITRNAQIIEQFLDEKTNNSLGNITIDYNKDEDLMLLRNYGTLIATRKGNKVKISNKRYSQTTSRIQNEIEREAKKRGLKDGYYPIVERVGENEFAKGGKVEQEAKFKEDYSKLKFKQDTEVQILDEEGDEVDVETYKKGEHENVDVLSADGDFLEVQFDDGYVAYINKEDVKQIKFAKGGEVKKKGTEMIMGGLAGILLGIFLNK